MISIRLGKECNDDVVADKMIGILKKYHMCCDRVWLEGPYGYPNTDRFEKFSNDMKKAQKKFTDAGFICDAQMSNTLGGHGIRNRNDFSAADERDFELAVGPNGVISEETFCYNGKNFRKYIAEAACLLAKTGVDTIWIDDDLRVELQPSISQMCFCDECIKKFNSLTGCDYSRETLVSQTLSDIDVRKKYIDFIRQSLYDFVAVIAKSAYNANPNIRLGYQSVYFTNMIGNDLNCVLDAMRKNTKRPPAIRPGGCVYTEHEPFQFLDKAANIERTISRVPNYVEDILPEVENCPDLAYNKTPYATCFEASLYMAYGCTDLSFAVMRKATENMNYRERLLKEFSRHRDYWDCLKSVNEKSVPTGAGLAAADFCSKNNASDVADYVNVPNLYGTFMRTLGIPETHSLKHNQYYAIFGDTIDYVNDDEIERLLNKNVFTDMYVIEKLCKRGFDKKLGFNVLKTGENIRIEEHYEDGLYMPIGAYKTRNYVLCDDKNVIKKYGDMYGMKDAKKIGTSAAVMNISHTGAKWAVIGFSPNNGFVSTSKRNQLLNMADYISGGTMPVLLNYNGPMAVKPRVNADGKLVCVTFVNASIGCTENLNIIIRNPASENFVYMSADSKEKIDFEITQTGEYKITLPHFERGWDIATLFCNN